MYDFDGKWVLKRSLTSMMHKDSSMQLTPHDRFTTLATLRVQLCATLCVISCKKYNTKLKCYCIIYRFTMNRNCVIFCPLSATLLWSDEMRSEVQMICIWFSWCHCHPIISCFSKIQNGLSFWYQTSQVVLEKRPLNGCVCVSATLSNTSSSSSVTCATSC